MKDLINSPHLPDSYNVIGEHIFSGDKFSIKVYFEDTKISSGYRKATFNGENYYFYREDDGYAWGAITDKTLFKKPEFEVISNPLSVYEFLLPDAAVEAFYTYASPDLFSISLQNESFESPEIVRTESGFYVIRKDSNGKIVRYDFTGTFDPFSISKMKKHYESDDSTQIFEYADWDEVPAVEGGIKLPKSIKYQAYMGDELTVNRSTKLQSLTVEAVVNSNEFEIDFKDANVIYDHVNDVTIDRDNKGSKNPCSD
ncbi:hypothetical protein [Persicirhabdus sediminis]|nr:hypothetical protein [Persicirhabdus sediminis]